ncbi:MAG: cupin domain-containing protein [Chitinispirillaceae bacterium]|nr:cupin domain-containing protein [Chitinispirillaceae bacterium]
MTEKGIPFSINSHIAYAEGSVVSKTIIDKKIGSITLFSFDAGQGLSEHTSPYDAVVQILDGKAVVTIGGTGREVASGEMIIMPAGIPHALHATQRFKMMLIMLRAETPQREKDPPSIAV